MLCCIWFGELLVRRYTSSLLGSYVHQTVILLNYVNDTNFLQWFSWKPKSFYCINSCNYSSVLQSSFSQVAIHLTIISSSLLQLYHCLFVVLGKLLNCERSCLLIEREYSETSGYIGTCTGSYWLIALWAMIGTNC